MLGTILGGRYHILQPLGGGGFARTYLAEDRQLPDQHRCVVKQLKPHQTDPATLQIARRLFETEAKILYQLGHHNQIPQLFAFFEEDQEFYLVQELIEGHDLSQELIPTSTSSTLLQWGEKEVIQFLEEILTVLEFVHQQNVIHRDINPRNIIRRKKDNQLVLIDFGAVKQITTQMLNNPGQTHHSVCIGTPGYMPPEQAKGNPKLSSDIYAVGMIAIQALTGIQPHQLPTDPDTEEVIWQDQAQVSPEFATFLNKMICYDFRERYRSATEALQAVKSLNQSNPTTVFLTTTSPNQIQTLGWKKRVGLFVLAGVALVGVGTGASAYLLNSIKSSTATDFYENGQTLLSLNRHEEALESFEKAIQLLSNYKEAWTGKGEVLDRLEKDTEAQKAYDQAIQIDPQYQDAWIGRGNVLRQLKRYEEALDAFKQAIAIRDTNPEAWLGEGHVLLNLMRYEQAIYAYRRALESSPTSYEAWYYKGWAHHNINQYEEAFKAYDEAVKYKLDDPQMWYNRGNILLLLNKPQEAIESYQKAVRFNPSYYQAWYSLGNAWRQRRDYKKAIESYEEAIKIKPNEGEAWYHLGWTLHELKRYQEALNAYTKTTELKPEYAQAWYNRGNVLYNLERYEEAIASYNEATIVQPNYPEAWYSKGNALLSSKQYETALTSYQQAIQYKPDYREAIKAKEKLEKFLNETQNPDAPLSDI